MPNNKPGQLGTFRDNGWAIRISPNLTKIQWSEYSARADEAWDPAIGNFNVDKAAAILRELFPTHHLVIETEEKK